MAALSRETAISWRALSRWWTRYQQKGREGLPPCSRRPRRSSGHLALGLERQILRLRRAGLEPARRALAVGVRAVRAYSVLARQGRNRRSELVRRRVQRHERGELLLKSLPPLGHPRQEYTFAAVDDFSREAGASIRAERSRRGATSFLQDVLARLPYTVEALPTDHDLSFTRRFAYDSQRKTYFEEACQSLGIQHRLLRPHRPESNGQVQRFTKTVDDECFAVRWPRSSQTRRRAWEEFLWCYNHQRPHLSQQRLTSVERREKYFLRA